MFLSDGSSLIFSVPTTTPNGTYKVSVSGFDSDWTDTPYTITVTGNGAGDPTTEVGDIQVIVSGQQLQHPSTDAPPVFMDSARRQTHAPHILALVR